MPSKKFADGAEIFEHCRRIAKHFGLYDGAMFSTQVRTVRWDEAIKRWRIEHQPRRRHPCPLRGHGAGLVQPAEAARHPRDQGLQGAHASTPRAGTTTTPAETPAAACDKLARQARRARRHRRDRGPAGSAPGPGCQASLRVPAHAVVGRRARQRAHRPEWATSLQPGWQEERKRNFHDGRRSRVWSSTSRTWSATSGPSSGRNMTARIAASRGSRIAGHRADHGDAGGRRLQDHGAAASPRRRHRRGSRDRRGAQAVLPIPVQAALLERRVPADLQPPERHAGRRVGVQGRGTAHRERHRRRRRRVRGRLRHLRQRLRDLHRDQPPLRDRRHRRS